VTCVHRLGPCPLLLWFSMVVLHLCVVRIGGAVCVAFNDNNSGTDHLYGDAICLFSAVM
jgi:hypothetical protein